MTDKRHLIIINSEQFGYHIDSYYYCKYLQGFDQISCICWDQGLPKITLEGVNVVYVSRSGGWRRVPNFLQHLEKCAKQFNPDQTIILVKYLKIMASLIRLKLRDYTHVLDIRTGDVSPNSLVRYCNDHLMRLEAKLYDNLTIISASLAKQLKLDHRARLVPLGSDEISSTDKSLDCINLLYVGTLQRRRLDTAIRGFELFCTDTEIPCKLTIIGSSGGTEEADLGALVQQLGAQQRVFVLGPIPHNQLEPYFDSHNIGLSFIPMTPYYDVQPPTKTFEYLLAGMPVLATATSENANVINQANGVLISDSVEGVQKGLQQLSEHLEQYSSSAIRQDSQRFRWGTIVESLDKYLSNL